MYSIGGPTRHEYRAVILPALIFVFVPFVVVLVFLYIWNNNVRVNSTEFPEQTLLLL